MVKKVLSVLIAISIIFSAIPASALTRICCDEIWGGAFCGICDPPPTTEQIALEADLVITGFVVVIVPEWEEISWNNRPIATVKITEVLKGDAQIDDLIKVIATVLNMVSTGFMYEGYDYMMLLTESSNHIGYYESSLGIIELYSPFMERNRDRRAIVRQLFPSGDFTTSDALLILRAAMGLLELTDEQAERFAISGGPATADALRILRLAVGL